MLSEQEGKNLNFGDVVASATYNFDNDFIETTTVKGGNVEVPIFGWCYNKHNDFHVMLNLNGHGRREVTPDFIAKENLCGVTPKDLLPYIGMKSGWTINLHDVIFVVTTSTVNAKVTLNHSGSNDGCTCIRCNNFYPYAEPNQPNGSLICYSCRTFGK